MIDRARLMEVVRYDPVTGEFTWLVTNSPRAIAGTRAGSNTTGAYRRICIDGVAYRAHRLAWLYVHGTWPESGIDHKDRNPRNNAINNLRVANQSENIANVGLKGNNTSGLKGVYLSPYGRYEARIQVRGKKRLIGIYDTPQQASQAYVQAAEEAFGAFAYTGTERAAALRDKLEGK